MNAKQPTVTVIVPTYNRPKLLEERALKSILAQTFRDWECIVVDASSNNATEELMRDYVAKDSRIRYLRVVDRGVCAARNEAIRQARGKYIALNDDDDEYLPGYLERVVSVFEKLPSDVGFVASGSILLDDRGERSLVVPRTEPPWSTSTGNGTIFRSECFLKSKIFFNERHYIEDIELHMRLDGAGYKGYVVAEPLRIYHMALGKDSDHLGSNHLNQSKQFDIFFADNIQRYQAYGKEALSWIFFFIALSYFRAGRIKEGRAYILKSLKIRISPKALLYACLAFLFPARISRIDFAIQRYMRYLRVHLLNKLG